MSLRPSRYRAEIQAAAAAIAWDPLLLEAQVWIESSDQADAFRYEPGFYRSYLQGKAAWEAWGPLAACSYGLLQVIYATARDDGFRGQPQDLFDPAVNVEVGCVHLAKLRIQIARPFGKAERTAPLAAVLAAYNGGLHGNEDPPYRNLAYAQKVLDRWTLLKGSV